MAPPALEESTVEARRAYLAPLVIYLRAHHYILCRVAQEAGERGGHHFPTTRVWQMARGYSVAPPWFVEQCCVVIEKPVEEVMGAEWVKRFGVNGRGRVEVAPVGPPRIQKPPKRPAHYQRRQSHVHDARRGGSELMTVGHGRQASGKRDTGG